MNIGDIVYLKSGGPAMTVKGVRQSDSNTYIKATWFPDTETVCEAEFHVFCLTTTCRIGWTAE